MLNSKAALLEHMTLKLDFINLDHPLGFTTNFINEDKIEIKGFTDKGIKFDFNVTLREMKKFMPNVRRCLMQSTYWSGALSNSLNLVPVVYDESDNRIIDTCSNYRTADELASDLWRTRQIPAAIGSIRVPCGMQRKSIVNEKVDSFKPFLA